MKKNKDIISISIDKTINEDMETARVNKSKLINHLLREHLTTKSVDKKLFENKK